MDYHKHDYWWSDNGSFKIIARRKKDNLVIQVCLCVILSQISFLYKFGGAVIMTVRLFILADSESVSLEENSLKMICIPYNNGFKDIQEI